MARGRGGGRGGGRVTPKQAKRRISRLNLLPLDIGMRRELVDGQDCIVVEFSYPNAHMDVVLTNEDWGGFCEDLTKIRTRGTVHEERAEETKSGIVIPGSKEAEDLGIMPRLRN